MTERTKEDMKAEVLRNKIINLHHYLEEAELYVPKEEREKLMALDKAVMDYYKYIRKLPSEKARDKTIQLSLEFLEGKGLRRVK